MLPLAGSNPTIPGYDQWLGAVSGIHCHLPREQKSRWLSTKWDYWFALGLSPRQAVELTRAWYENYKLEREFRDKYGYGPELPSEINWQLKQADEIAKARKLFA